MSVLLMGFLVVFALAIVMVIFMAISDRKIVKQREEEDRIKALEEAKQKDDSNAN